MLTRSLALLALLLVVGCDSQPSTQPASQTAGSPAGTVAKKPDWREQNKSIQDTVRIMDEAKRNTEAVQDAIAKGDQAAAEQLVGKLVNIGGKLVQQQETSWILSDESKGITVIAYFHEPNLNQNNPPSEVIGAAAMGLVKSVDLAKKTVTVEDADMSVASGSPEAMEQLKKKFGQ